MKKLLILLLFALGLMQSKAQSIDTTNGLADYDSTDYDFSRKWSKLYLSIDLTHITTGFFIDRAVNWIDPAKHTGNPNGNQNDDNTYFETICSVHQAFLMASLGDTAHRLFDSTDALRAKVQSYLNDNKIPITAFYMKYNYILSSAFDDGILSFNSTDTLIYTSDSTQTPFGETATFLAAPALDQIVQGTCNFIVPSDLYLTNSNKTLSKIEIRFGSLAQWQEMTLNTVLSIDFSNTEGNMTIDTRFTYSDGTVLTSRTPIAFKKKPGTYAGPYQNANATWDIAGTSSHDGAIVKVAYGCGKTKLTKPFIIIEPFDVNDEFTLSWMLHTLSGSMPLLLKELETQGYDLVYIDFKHNTDYIERNSACVKQIIDQVNSTKATNGSSEPNTVMGISMGGVIGRYTLRNMEINSQNHQTNSFISVDAPHRGAYVPISVQYMLKSISELANMKKVTIVTPYPLPDVQVDVSFFNLPTALRRAIDIASTPAAKQMEIYNIFDDQHAAVFNSLGLETLKMNND
ncbi:MAG: hypothetical protein ACHQK8_00670, partial [Bacteroidia bacterium]